MPMLPVKFVTLHCTATPEGRDVKAATINEWDRAKFDLKPDEASYHWTIELDGTRVRNMPDTMRGAHVGGHNSHNIGISYVGGVDKLGNPKDTRTPEQRESLKALCQAYKAKYPQIVILGHRDWPGVAKACPSFNTKAWLREIGLIKP